MASAEKRPVGQFEYVLTLTEDEAKVLYRVLGLVSGDPVTSNRKHTSKIRNALGSVGFTGMASDSGFSGNVNSADL